MQKRKRMKESGRTKRQVENLSYGSIWVIAFWGEATLVIFRLCGWERRAHGMLVRAKTAGEVGEGIPIADG